MILFLIGLLMVIYGIAARRAARNSAPRIMPPAYVDPEQWEQERRRR